MICSQFLIIVMVIRYSYDFVINHGCQIDEIQAMKTNTLHLVNTSSFTSHTFH